MEHKLKIGLISAISAALLATNVQAANLDLSTSPLYLTTGVAPNIMLLLDDSRSMTWEAMPGDLMSNPLEHDPNFIPFVYPYKTYTYSITSTNNRNVVAVFDDSSAYSVRARSSAINKIYYNPKVTYTPWANSDGSLMAQADPSCALDNPIAPIAALGKTVIGTANRGCLKLNGSVTANADWYNGNDGSLTSNTSKAFWPAVYYTYNGGNKWSTSSYTKTEIKSRGSYTGGPDRSDCAHAPTCTYNEEMQNFANWYSYYRSRVLTVRAGIGHAFAEQGENIRVGFTTIDIAAQQNKIIKGVRKFSGTNRIELFKLLYNEDIYAGTRTRNALYHVGNYFKTDEPWSANPGGGTGEVLSCRQSYNILTTDGYWTDGDSFTISNQDGSNGNNITGPNNDAYQYTPHSPYKDSYSNTLADVAMHFWKTDLRPDLTNDVPSSNDDPAFWQHLVNFTVGLGVSGSIDQNTDFNAIENNNTPFTWPQPMTSFDIDIHKIDDLLHAAVNSHGKFFSATNPKKFSDALSNILQSIGSRRAAASSISIFNNSGSAVDSKLYQAKYDSSDWSGQLLAYELNGDGSVKTAPSWDAAEILNNTAPRDRAIFTYRTDGIHKGGTPFKWNNLSAAQQTLLGSEKVLKYTRGDQSNEGSGYRKRNSLLGDLVHSNPTYVGAPAQRYPNNWGKDIHGHAAPENEHPYSTFRANNHDRKAMVYVGANDGMLHAFNADTGKEKFAYVPNAVMANLPKLTKPNYSHQYYVDGSPTIADAYFDNDSKWHTVLVGGLRGGGQGIYALDVTDPDSFTAQKVLWEYTDKDDNGLGYTFGTPSVARLNNGQWAVVVSGGYNNTVKDNHFYKYGYAFLYIINLKTGKLIRKLSTNVGNHTQGSDGSRDPMGDPSGKHRPNGLSTPSVVDLDGNYIADVIYAGDLFGNVWKIDVSNEKASKWKFSNKGTDNYPQPIFTACSTSSCNTVDNNNIQAITTQIQAVKQPQGVMLLFGTGKYLEAEDNLSTGQTTQSFYGILDKSGIGPETIDKSKLLQQKITDEVSVDGNQYRVTSNNKVKDTDKASNQGWYIDLVSPSTGKNRGEKQISNALIKNGNVIFSTLLPNEDSCGNGISSWIMELDLRDGSRSKSSPYDVNGDGKFDAGDLIDTGSGDDKSIGSGIKSETGSIGSPSILTNKDGKDYLYLNDTNGNIKKINQQSNVINGRQSWRKLDRSYNK